jgi:hypothetical protein
MNRPPIEGADIIRVAGGDFLEKQRSRLTGLHRKILSAIERCRTAALGGHRDRCSRCGHTTTAITYNSCRKRQRLPSNNSIESAPENNRARIYSVLPGHF